MSKFVLTAQLQLQAPKNTQQVVSQMRRQLSGINVNVGVQGAPQAQKQVAKVNQQVQTLNKSGARLGKTFGLAINRFAAFTVASRAVSLFTNNLASATKEAIDFERELVKISQVTGKSVKELSGLSNTITKLSVSLGTSSKDLLATSRILAQTGLEANNLEVALKALAKTTLAPTFEDITKTAEGAVAILAQFGQGVGALESQLGAINAVAGQFAVESGDLISVVRRTGGVFKAAGGDLNELLGLFTSVRATTRESAESIATGLRTIFTRIQRPKTIEFLKQFGVELTDLNGKFVGPFEAVRQLSQALSGLGEGDIRFVQIAEELGGFRQIGKVIPLLQQFETAERARQAALEGGDSLTKDAATAQQALAVQITKVKEEFLALVRSISQTGSFQTLVKTTLDLASALISVADALKPIIPLLTVFAGIKLAKGLSGFGTGLGAALKGGPRGFNSGGLVPGTGNRDTVPAMLTPGEFVIRKSSVKKMGVGALAEMNGNKYNKGGSVSINPNSRDIKVLVNSRENPGNVIPTAIPIGDAKGVKSPLKTFGADVLAQAGITNLGFNSPLTVSGFNDNGVFDKSKKKVVDAGKKMVSELKAGVNGKTPNLDRQEDNIVTALNTSLGRAFEEYIGDIGQFDSPGSANFDIPRGRGAKLQPYTAEPFDADTLGEIKIRDTEANLSSVIKKAANEGMFNSFIRSRMTKDSKKGGKGRKRNFFGGAIQKFALGGLAQKNRVGFAILDPDRKAQDMDAKVTRAQIRSVVKGTDSQKKALDKELSWANKNFKVATQGLNAKTSQKFYDTLSREAAQGVSVAAAGLSSDLGLGNITVPEASKQLMADTIRKSGAQMGRLFEDVVNVMDGRGKFAPAPPGAPFDFKGGLQGALKDNYDRLPSTFVDAKTSYTEATAAEAQKKIINEIAQTYQQTPTYASSKKGDKKSETDKQAAARIAREQKGQARLAKLRAKAGYNMGGAAPSDTVPALLTPGEFVINAKSAAKIGKANLDRMNKHGVQGFATGGVVQRFAKGGGAPYSTPQRFDSKGFPVDPKALSEVTKQASLQEKIMKKVNPLRERVAKTLQDMPNKFNDLKQGVQQASDRFKQSDGFKVAKENIDKGLAKISNGLRDGEQKVKNGFGLVKGSVQQAASDVKSGLSQYRQSIQTGASQLKGSLSSLATTVNSGGESTFRRFFAGIDRQTPTLQSAFKNLTGGIAGRIKNIVAPLDKAAGETQKVAGKLSASANAVRTPVANAAVQPPPGTQSAYRALIGLLNKENVSRRKQMRAFSSFTQSIRQGDTAASALFKGMKSGGISLKSLERSAQRAAAANEKEANASNKAAAADANEAAKSGAMGGGGAMGAFFAIQAVASMIPQVEGAKEGFGAIQNQLGPLTMQLGTLGILVSSLPPNLQKFGGAIAASFGAVYAITSIIDAYTGVHIKAKEAIEKGNADAAGTAAVASQAQKDLNKLALGATAAGAAVGFAFGGPFGAAVGSAIGGLVGLAGKFLITEKAMASFRDNVLVLFGADSTSLIKARAEAEASLIRIQKEAAENAKKMSEAMKEVAAGDRTLRSIFQGENAVGTADIRNIQAAQQRQFALTAEVEATDAGAQRRNRARRRIASLGFDEDSLLGGTDLKSQAATMAIPVVGPLISNLKFMARVLDNTSETSEAVRAEQVKELELLKQLREAQLKNLPSLIKLSKQAFVAGKGFDEFKKDASEVFGQDFESLDPSVRAKATQAYVNNAKAVAESTAAFAASSMGLRPFRTFVDGLSTSLDRTTSVLDGKFNSLSSAIDIAGAALSGAQVDEDIFNRSLAEINSNLAAFGVSSASISKINSSFSALRTATTGFDTALQAVSKKVISGEVSGTGIKDEIVKQLANLPGLDEEGKRIIQNIFGGIEDLSEDEIAQLQAGNFDAILKKLDEAGAKAFKEVNETSKALADAQNKLLSITQKRAEAELKAIEAQKKAISLQEEAAGILAEAAGKQLSSEEKLDFNRRRLAADLRGGAGSDGSVAGIMTRIGQIQAGAAGATSRLSSIAGGGEGDTFRAAEDQRTLADSTRQLNSLAEFARKRVQIYKQELEIVKKKNALEKSSLEKLIAGDTLGFIEDQSAAAAQAALRSGDKSLAALFSSKALSTALKNLEGQGLSDAERRTAAATALGPGFATARNIGVLTETTSEERALRAGMSEQAQILNAIAPAIQQLGSADFEIATAGLQYANDQFVSAQQKAAAASEKFANTMREADEAAARQKENADRIEQQTKAQIEADKKAAEKQAKAERDLLNDQKGEIVDIKADAVTIGKEVERLAKGGMVYASRGMFVPRGTDTVPAMLTPGEFVVNRAAVQRGNNLQVLKAMNGNGAAPAPAAEGMSNGGVVYRRRGSTGPETGGMDMSGMFKTFESSARMFNDAVNRLVGFKLNVQLDPTNVNVNLNGGTFLNNMKEELKRELLSIVSERIRSSSFDYTGDINIDPVAQRIV